MASRLTDELPGDCPLRTGMRMKKSVAAETVALTRLRDGDSTEGLNSLNRAETCFRCVGDDRGSSDHLAEAPAQKPWHATGYEPCIVARR